jgi:GAF domain-containing protein
MLTLDDDQTLLQQAEALLGSEPDPIANAANLAALIFERVDNINWAGFYFLDGDELVLGPFQGRLACTRIPVGQGVCGTAAARRETQRIADVDAFDGHIACDSASRSELVVPLCTDGRVIGVLDIDAPVVDRFDADDQARFEALAACWLAHSDLRGWRRG